MSNETNDLAAAIAEENARDIDTYRGELTTALNEALSALRRASQAAATLVSPHVYDVEIAEGPDDQDLAEFLEVPARSTRAAYRIVHHINEHTY